MHKPLVLVQEADPAKGGGTLPALRAECPEELQPDIFDKDWRHTIWYRIQEFQLVSLQITAEALLLCSTNFLGSTSLPLTVTGELRIRAFGFSTFAKVWASPANAGARELAEELVAAFPGLTVSTAEEAGDATHMLLYLNEHSFSDERLAEQVTQARQDRLPIVMAHENDPDLGGCEFSKFFETTPQVERRMLIVTPVRSPPLPHNSLLPTRRRSSSRAGSTRTSRARASPGATARRALAPSPPGGRSPAVTPRCSTLP